MRSQSDKLAERELKRRLQNSYSRGYATGARGAWPEFKPPNPPQEQVAALFIAAKELADAAHNLLTFITPDEPVSLELKRQVDMVDTVFEGISRWLKDIPESGKVKP